MSALGQERSFAPGRPNVRFAPIADIQAAADFTAYRASSPTICPKFPRGMRPLLSRKQKTELALTVSELLDTYMMAAPYRAELVQQTILLQRFLQTRNCSKRYRNFTEPRMSRKKDKRHTSAPQYFGDWPYHVAGDVYIEYSRVQ